MDIYKRHRMALDSRDTRITIASVARLLMKTVVPVKVVKAVNGPLHAVNGPLDEL